MVDIEEFHANEPYDLTHWQTACKDHTGYNAENRGEEIMGVGGGQGDSFRGFCKSPGNDGDLDQDSSGEQVRSDWSLKYFEGRVDRT